MCLEQGQSESSDRKSSWSRIVTSYEAMRVAIICLCLVVICEAWGPHGPNAESNKQQFSRLIDLLQRSIDRTEVEERGKPINRPVYDADREDARTYDLDRLFTFPGSDFLEKMIARSFSRKEAFSPSEMEEFAANGPRYMNWFLRSVDAQWFGSMPLFYNDWVGLPELFTMRITKMVATARMSCPSTFFDRFFARWSMNQLGDMFAQDDDSMVNVFMANFKTLFPTLTEEDVLTMASDATYGVHGWIVEELMQHIYGSGFRDVAVFSHKLYYRIWQYVNYNMTNSPWNPAMPALSTFVWPVWRESGVRCETGEAVMDRHNRAIAIYKERYEQITLDVIRGRIESFIMEQASAFNIKFPEEVFPKVMGILTKGLWEYIDDVVEFLKARQTAMDDMDYGSMLQFFEGLEGVGEKGFAKMMFSRLGLIPGSPTRR